MPVYPGSTGLLLLSFCYGSSVYPGGRLSRPFIVLFLVACRFGRQGPSSFDFMFTWLPCPYHGHAMYMWFFSSVSALSFLVPLRRFTRTLENSGYLILAHGLFSTVLSWCSFRSLAHALAWVLCWSLLLQEPGTFDLLLFRPCHLS